MFPKYSFNKNFCFFSSLLLFFNFLQIPASYCLNSGKVSSLSASMQNPNQNPAMGFLTRQLLCSIVFVAIMLPVLHYFLDQSTIYLYQPKLNNVTKYRNGLDKALAGAATRNKTVTKYRNGLDKALAGAATRNKTVIIAIVNKAYIEGHKPMFELFLDGFRLGEDTRNLIRNLLIVAVDDESYQWCQFQQLHCYMLKTEGMNLRAEKVYMTKDFVRMMWRRTLFLLDVLKLGYNFIFTDTDVLWLRNPFPILLPNQSQLETMDLQISVDHFNGNHSSEKNLINTGFYMVRSNNKTIALFNEWYSRKDKSPGMKEQDVLQNLIWEGLFRKLGLKVAFLDTLYFGGICAHGKDFQAVTTLHANCCPTIKAKKKDLTAVIRSWKKYRGSQNKSRIRWPKHKNCKISMDDYSKKHA